MLPKLSRQPYTNLEETYKYLFDPKNRDFLETLLKKHPEGEDDYMNPFVPVLRDHQQASQTGDDWLATIIWGQSGVEGKDIKRAPDLGTFRVPIERLKEPLNSYARDTETERLFVGDDLQDFLETWIDNPYYGPIQSRSERMKQSLERYGR